MVGLGQIISSTVSTMACGMTSVMSAIFVIFSIILTINIGHINGSKAEFVSCGSILKLINVNLRIRLHSHDVKYGSGSGQQSVTGIDVQDDNNSHWQIKGETGKQCKRGEPIKCGSVIRLYHIATVKNLHSHYFSSPLSGNQEISCYGDSRGEGDTGDHWTLECNNDYWRRDTPIRLKHVDTEMYLAGSGRTFGRPINGQGEIVGVSSIRDGYTEWQAMEGLFIHQDDLLANKPIIHTEL